MEITITDQEKFDNRPLLPVDIKEKWLNALRSGEYTKGREYLCSDNKYDCLGVLCEIQGIKRKKKKNAHTYYQGCTSILSEKNPMYSILGDNGKFNGFNIRGTEGLASINDTTETFDEVIEVIEKYF